jgi:hypothetical protein
MYFSSCSYTVQMYTMHFSKPLCLRMNNSDQIKELMIYVHPIHVSVKNSMISYGVFTVQIQVPIKSLNALA